MDANSPTEGAARDRPDDTDRLLAAIAHLFGVLAALIVLMAGEQRPAFVRLHALQALVFHIAVWFTMFALVLAVSTIGAGLTMVPWLAASGSTNPEQLAGTGFAVTLLLFWLGCAGLQLWAAGALALQVYAGIRAFGGHEQAYPLFGRRLLAALRRPARLERPG